ncbi:hypothetical protein M422DRAFT_255816 [Sphaerobolus stellatus SS14]|uniref:Uncharacterized protein n=1 Tax=Sphaerobolus stellatus (strain SS14) TaxID=990650 RepID=A0A0C9VEG6_SPHS4|nr:hypothetical protein M422DRAFT_261994 [Sphaerobolus stellatus SS14]KIJ41306.1 hypothetical protein M422DRAFT_255816 [Sphaerobolus stellatus SS14]
MCRELNKFEIAVLHFLVYARLGPYAKPRVVPEERRNFLWHADEIYADEFKQPYKDQNIAWLSLETRILHRQVRLRKLVWGKAKGFPYLGHEFVVVYVEGKRSSPDIGDGDHTGKKSSVFILERLQEMAGDAQLVASLDSRDSFMKACIDSFTPSKQQSSLRMVGLRSSI